MPGFKTVKDLASLALLPFYATSRAISASDKPRTIPALQTWSATSGNYTLTDNARIILQGARLADTAAVFAEDLQLLTGLALPVMNDEQILAGDLVLILDENDSDIGKQGYYLEISDCVRISAHSDDGAFYGTRTLLQLFAQSLTIRRGMARDWPDYPQRSLMVDVGRQYFSLPWLENHIRDLAYLKYNFFHLHFSDNFGFRLESERHPEIVSPQYYTKAEVRALQELARKYRITIVPEIDVPGHLDAALARHPELRLTNKATGQAQAGDLDLSSELAYAFVQDLLEEYIPLFSGPYWHLGADEYLLHGGSYADFPQLEQEAKKRYGEQASGKDLYLGFVNWAHELVKAHGKTTRVWSDGLYGGSTVTTPTDHIIYEHWVSWGLTPGEIVERGIPIVNSNIHYVYYVPGSPRMRARPDVLYENFEPHMFCLDFNALDNVTGVAIPKSSSATHSLTFLQHHPLHLGAKLHVWCDDPTCETEEQIAAAIKDALRALVQKNWGSPRLVERYDDFKPIINAIGHAPGYLS